MNLREFEDKENEIIKFFYLVLAMIKRIKRRVFIRGLFTATFTTVFLGGCVKREKDNTLNSEQEKSNFEEKIALNKKLPRELVMKLLDQKVDSYMQQSHHCAQSSFLALKEQFGLTGDEIVRALTPLTGIAERGETCGAVTGPLMAFGLIYGRGQHQLDNWETYRASLVPSGEFCSLFEKEFGSTMCSDIQQVKFGKCFHLTNPEELQEFQEANATSHCSAVVRKAVRIAAEIILNDQ